MDDLHTGEFPEVGRCDYGHGCARIGPLRQVQSVPGYPRVPLYGCQWHVAAVTRWKRAQSRSGSQS